MSFVDDLAPAKHHLVETDDTILRSARFMRYLGNVYELGVGAEPNRICPHVFVLGSIAEQLPRDIVSRLGDFLAANTHIFDLVAGRRDTHPLFTYAAVFMVYYLVATDPDLLRDHWDTCLGLTLNLDELFADLETGA